MPKRHKGFYMDVDGEPVHMLADPNMTPETQAALEALVRAARKMVEAMPVYQCAECGQLRASAEDGVCTQCKIDDLWKGLEG